MSETGKESNQIFASLQKKSGLKNHNECAAVQIMRVVCLTWNIQLKDTNLEFALSEVDISCYCIMVYLVYIILFSPLYYAFIFSYFSDIFHIFTF